MPGAVIGAVPGAVIGAVPSAVIGAVPSAVIGAVPSAEKWRPFLGSHVINKKSHTRPRGSTLVPKYSLAHLPDDTIASNLKELNETGLATKATLLAHLAEFDERNLHVPAAYQSLLEYCMGHLGWNREASLKRMRAARTAKRYPAIFRAVEMGRVHLSAIVLLTPHLTQENARELIEAASGKTKAEVEEMLKIRSQPSLDMSDGESPTASSSPESGPSPLAPGPSSPPSPPGPSSSPESAPSPPGPSSVTDKSYASLVSPGTPDSDGLDSKRESLETPKPLENTSFELSAVDSPRSAYRFPLNIMMDEEMRDDLEYARELLGHAIPLGSTREIIRRALKTLIRLQERRKAGAAARTSRAGRSTVPGSQPAGRHIPAQVRLAVWRRDEGRCTFVSKEGRRCKSRRRLEFDHLVEFSRGGPSTVENLRLLCRVHNQHAADLSFGRKFMQERRGKPTRIARRSSPSSERERQDVGTEGSLPAT